MIDKNTNSENLPVIEENSLHRIVTTVKLYQEFKELGKEKFEEIYGKADPKSLEGVCYKKYYEGKSENEKFKLLNSPLEKTTNQNKNSPFLKGVAGESQTGYSLEIGEYLKVELDENKKVTAIQSLQPFYWKEWSFEEGIERMDWSRKAGKQNFIFDNKQYPSFFVKYDFSFSLTDIIFGKVNYLDDNSYPKNPKTYFQDSVNFYNSIFKYDVSFKYCIFNSWVSFSSAIFGGCVNFSQSSFNIEFNISDFSECFFKKEVSFLDCHFNKEINFYNSTFKDSTTFSFSTFESKTNFYSCTFENRVDFNYIICKASAILIFNYINVEKKFSISIKKIENENGKLEIGFDNSSFDKKLCFSILDDSQYKQITLNLKDISYGDFVCEDYNFHQTKLWHSETKQERQDCIRNKLPFKNKQIPLSHQDINEYDNLKLTDVTEQAIAERRVFRKILQDLNWSDKADEQYARIMDLQLALDWKEKGLNIENFSKKWVYKIAFGWGVRLKNVIFSGLFFIFSFAIIYTVYDYVDLPWFDDSQFVPIHNLPKVVQTNTWVDIFRYFRFSVWNSFLLADLTRDYGWLITFISTLQGVLGIMYVTVLVAIISRKFMRM
jgi:hypothetical protein